MNGAVANVLNSVLGSWVENVNSEQLKLSIFSGQVNLSNLMLKESAIDSLGFPFKLRSGCIKSLDIDIPWSSLASNPLKIQITGINALISPVSPDSWSEEKEKAKEKIFRRTILENFEAISNTEISVNEDQGFMAKLVNKIVLNVQVKISCVYIRYEDDISSTRPFAAGFVIKSLKAVTCDEDWSQKYIESAPINYKLVEIEGISLYIDYKSKLEQNYKAFADMIDEEMEKEVDHFYILSPTTYTLKARINTNPKDLSIPQYSLNLHNPKVRFAVEMEQLFHVMKVLEFMQTFDNFRNGIKKSVTYPEIQGEQLSKYKELYKEYRLTNKDSKKAKEIKKNLTEIEEGYDVYSIIGQRKYIDKELELIKKERGLLEEIKKTEEEAQGGTLSKFTGFLWGKSDSQKKQDDENRKKKISDMKAQLQNVLLEKQAFAEEMKSWVASDSEFSAVPKDFVQFLIKFEVDSTAFALRYDEQDLIVFKMRTFQVTTGIRIDSFYVKLKISRTSIQDKVIKSADFPYILRGKPLKAKYETLNKQKLSLHSGGIIVYGNFFSLFKVNSLFAELLDNTSDELKKNYLKQISETSLEYMKQGENYMKDLLKNGVTETIELDIDIKAPLVCIPLDINSKSSGMLIMDFGNLDGKTSTSNENDFDFFVYSFAYKEMRACVAWDFNDINSWQEGSFTEILLPVDYTLELKNCAQIQYTVPSLRAKVIFPKIKFAIHDTVLKFILKLHKQVIGIFAEASSADPMQKAKRVENFKRNSVAKNSVIETEGYKDQMKRIKKIIAVKFGIVFEEIDIVIIENSKLLTGFGILNLKAESRLSSDGEISGEITLGRLELKDHREGIILNKAISNPLLESLESRKSLNAEEILQIRMNFLMKPKTDVVDIGIYINDMRVILSSSLFNALQNFFKESFSLIELISQESSSTEPQEEKYSYTTNFNTRIVIQLTNFELWLPLSLTQLHKRTGCFFFGACIEYKSSQQYKISLNEEMEEIKREYLHLSDEASIELTGIGGLIGLINKNRVVLSEERTYDLIPPSRFGIYYTSSKPKNEPIIMNFQVNLESIQLDIGLRDVQYAKTLAEQWIPATAAQDEKAVDMPKVSTKTQFLVDCDAFKVTLLEDTGVKAYTLLVFHMSSFKVSGNFEVEKIEASMSTFLFSDYYNLKMCAWEPLIENWDISSTLVQNSKETPVLIRIESPTMLNINVTMSMIEIMGTLMQKLGENSSFWAEDCVRERALTDQNELLAHGQFFYNIENAMGTSLQVWLDLPKTEVDVWILGIGQTQMFSYEQLQEKINMSSLKKGLSNGITEEVQVPISLCLKIEGYEPVKGLHFERLGTRGFELVSGERKINCILTVESKENLRVVRFESGKVCMNNTSSPLVLICGSSEYELEAGGSYSLPLKWNYATEKPTVLTKNGPVTFFDNKAIELITGDWAVITICEYKTETRKRQTIIQFNTPFCFENLMPGLMTVYSNKSDNPIGVGNAGSRINCSKLNPNSSNEFSFKFEFDSGLMLQTEWAGIGCKPHSIGYKGTFVGQSVMIDPSVMDIKKNRSIDLTSRRKIRLQDPDVVSAKNVEIYSSYIIINKTEFDIELSNSKSSVSLTPYTMCLYKINRMKLKILKEKYGEPSELSKDLNIEAIGISGCVSLQFKQVNEITPKEVILGISVASASRPLIKTKIVTIVPRFILTNELEYDIFIRQYFRDSEGGITSTLISGATLSYNLENSEVSKLIQISRDGLNWSSPFSLQNIEDFQVKFLSREENRLVDSTDQWYKPQQSNSFNHIVRVIVTTEDQASLHTIITTPSEPEFAINNTTQETIKIRQKKFPQIVVPAFARVPWVFDSLDSEKIIEMTIGGKTKELNIEKVKKSKKFSKFRFETRVVGVTREVVISLSRGSMNSSVEGEGPRGKLKVEMNFRGLGISVIDSTPHELFYFSAIEIKNIYKEKEEKDQKRLEKSRKFKLLIGKIQLDNMQAKGKLFPMILGPSQKNNDENIPMLQLEIDRTSFRKLINKGVYERDPIKRFSWVELALQEMRLNVNHEVINESLEFYAEVMRKLAWTQSFKPFPNKIVEMRLISPGLDPAPCKLSKNLLLISSKSYFKLVHLCAVKVIISFKTSSKNLELNIDPREGFGLVDLFGSIGGTFINISDSPLYFKEIFIQESFQTISTLSGQILSNYQRQGILQFYKVLGSSDIIGNPVGLIDRLGTGVLEFFNEPVKGVIKGPKAFAEGMSKGIRSLVGNIVAGSFGSISKITGNLYGLVREVGGDTKGADRINDSDNAVDNIYQGIKGGVIDLAEGVTGIFLKPWKGAKREGAKGLLKGIGSGLLGIVTSPLSAALRIGSGLTTGVTNAATFLARGKVTPMGRARFPRHFSPKKVLEYYNFEVAEAQDFLLSLPDHRKESIVFYMRIEEEESIIIIITLKSFLFIVNADLIQKYDLEKIDSVEVHMPADNNFYIRIGCENEEALVISSKNYSPLIKLYAAVISLTNPAKPKKGVKKILAPNRYGNSCCKPKKREKIASRYSLAQRK